MFRESTDRPIDMNNTVAIRIVVRNIGIEALGTAADVTLHQNSGKCTSSDRESILHTV